jgi:hypothetical protein
MDGAGSRQGAVRCAQARLGRRVDRIELIMLSSTLTTAGRDIAEKRHRMRFRRQCCGASTHVIAQRISIALSRRGICEDLATEEIKRKRRADLVSSEKGWVDGSNK